MIVGWALIFALVNFLVKTKSVLISVMLIEGIRQRCSLKVIYDFTHETIRNIGSLDFLSIFTASIYTKHCVSIKCLPCGLGFKYDIILTSLYIFHNFHKGCTQRGNTSISRIQRCTHQADFKRFSTHMLLQSPFSAQPARSAPAPALSAGCARFADRSACARP